MSASMFPARAGMSRADFSRRVREENVPRASGDEPLYGGGVAAQV